MTDWIEDGEAGSSVRAKLNDVPNNGFEVAVTTGGTQTDFDPATSPASIVAVTTGGTAGDEVFNLAAFPLTVDGTYNPNEIGTQITVYLAVQTHPADVLKVQTNGGGFLAVKDEFGNQLATVTDGFVVLDDLGQSATMQWDGQEWILFRYAPNDFSVYGSKRLPLPALPAGNENQHILRLNQVDPVWTGGAGVVQSYEYLETGASPKNASRAWSGGFLESGGTAGTESLTIDAPTLEYIGSRHWFHFAEQTNPADVISLAVTNIKNADGSAMVSILMAAPEDYVILEAVSPTLWHVIYASTGICTPEVIAPAFQTAASGSFLTADAKTITVVNGIITNIA